MTISVVMPAYNAAEFITQAIESVLCQTYEDFELLVINDGSTDDTFKIVNQYIALDPRIKVFDQENKGTAPTLNRGIALAKSDWVFLMHADDIMRPNRLERQLVFIAEHPELSVVSTLVRHIDSKNRIIGRDHSKLVSQDVVASRISSNELIGISHPAVAFRKDAVTDVGGYRQEFWPAEDIDLWNRLVEKGHKLLVQPEFLLDYRMHGNSASIAGARLTRAKVRWLKACMLQRRAGKPEPSWENFLDLQRSDSFYFRWNRERKDLAKTFYKAAVLHYAQRRYLPLSLKLLSALLLQPIMTISSVRTKLVLGGKDSE